MERTNRNNLLLFNIGRRWFRSLNWLGPRKQLQPGSLWHLRGSPFPNPSFMRRRSHWCRALLHPTIQLPHPNRPRSLNLWRGHGSLQHRSWHWHWRRRRRGLRRVPSPGDDLLHCAGLGDACREPDLAAGGGRNRTHRGRRWRGLLPRAPRVPGPGSGGRHHGSRCKRRRGRRRTARRGGLEGGALVLVEVTADAGRVGEEGRHRGCRRSGGRRSDRHAWPCDRGCDGGRGGDGAVRRARGAAANETNLVSSYRKEGAEEQRRARVWRELTRRGRRGAGARMGWSRRGSP